MKCRGFQTVGWVRWKIALISFRFVYGIGARRLMGGARAKSALIGAQILL
jgi:hypothetical protein